mgnify:CR=1 FL=1
MAKKPPRKRSNKTDEEKPQKPSDAWHHAARKIGESVRFSFLRCIMKEMKCDVHEAQRVFETALESGDIIFTGMAGFFKDVPKYKMK